MGISPQSVDASCFHFSSEIKHMNSVLYFLNLPKFLTSLISTGKLFWGYHFCEGVFQLMLNVLTREPEAMGLKRHLAVACLTNPVEKLKGMSMPYCGYFALGSELISAQGMSYTTHCCIKLCWCSFGLLPTILH